MIPAKNLSGFREPSDVNDPVFKGRFQRENYVIEKYFVKGEGDYVIPLSPDDPRQNQYIKLSYTFILRKSAEAAEGGEIEWFVKNGYVVLAT